MKTLSRGQKVRLSELCSSLNLQVRVECNAPALAFDFSCFGLDENGRLSDDRYFVFYNQKSSPESALKLENNGVFVLNLTKLPSTIQRLVFVATIDSQGTMANLSNGAFSLCVGADEVARFEFQGRDFERERAVMVAEIYRREGWRLAAVGQGFAGGLDAVLAHFGGQQSEDATTAAPSAAAPSAAAPSVAAPSVAAPSVAAPSVAAPSVAAPSVAAQSAADVDATGSIACVRCGKGAESWVELRKFNPDTGRCTHCDTQVQAALEALRCDFLEASRNGVLEDAPWQAMWERFDGPRQQVSHSEALEFLRADTLLFVERLLTMANADGVITPAEESYIKQMLGAFGIPSELQRPIKARLQGFKALARIRGGYLPTVTGTGHHLDAGELCHLAAPATFRKTLTRTGTDVAGTLLVTNKRVFFVPSDSKGWIIQYRNILQVKESSETVYVAVSGGSGNGHYLVPDTAHAEAVLTTLTLMAKRQLLGPQEELSRYIPQTVKNAVWQRDGGRCVLCGSQNYLEFDHDIPHSKGGANTEGNVQLLCRKCNLAKGNRL